MYKLNLGKVYVSDRVEKDEAAMERMNRMAKAIGLSLDDVTRITDAEIPDLIAENGWQHARTPQGMLKEHKPLDIVFNAFKFNGGEAETDEAFKRCPEGTPKSLFKSLLGYCTPALLAHPRDEDQKNNCVCWSENEFVTIEGCPHGCKYCDGGQLININLNLEEFAERIVGPALKQNPWQKCYRCNTTLSDTICFEPEYGLHEVFTKKFAEFNDRYLYIHTKSANVDFIGGIEHKDRLINVWSIPCDRTSREIEPGSATALERIEAARKCQEMDIPIRYKFKPIIPIKGWREEYSAIIKEMFRRTSPEIVGFCVLMWMDAERLKQIYDPAIFDPAYIAAMEEAAGQMKGVRTGPFPHKVRAEIYRFFIEEVRRWDKSVPLFISTESREMWDELKDLLGASPAQFACGCGPICAPGPCLKASKEAKTSTYAPQG